MPQSAKPAFKAVVFDLDGTLLDTLDDLTDAANTVLSMRGFPARTKEEMKIFVGDGILMLCRRILPENAKDDKTVAGCVDDFRQVYGKIWNVKTGPYNGVGDMLARLGGMGLMLAILSNKPDGITRETVKYFFPDVPFKMVFGEREGIPKKPHPQGALEIADQLLLNPAEILYLGDTSVDMETARAAGMHPVGALWGFRSKEELVNSGAADLAQTPSEVVAIAERKMKTGGRF